MRGEPKISHVYHMGEPTTPADPERTFARIWRWCRDLWVKNGTIVARPSELPPNLRGPMVEWANTNYGDRQNAKKH